MRTYGWSEAETLLMNVNDRIPPKLRLEALATLAQLSQTGKLEPYWSQWMGKKATLPRSRTSLRRCSMNPEQMYAVATTERIIGGRGKNDGH